MKDRSAQRYRPLLRVALAAPFAAAAAWMALAALASGCASHDESATASCPRDLPSACPATPPSYARDVAPIIGSKCFPCHGPGGIEDTTHDLATYDHVFAQRTDALTQVYSCAMPTKDGTPLTAAERATLLAWLVCHAPNN